MKKGTILALLATVAAGTAAAVLLGRQEPADAAPDESAPMDADQTVAFPLKNKYADYSGGESHPSYRFELETPNGVKEIAVSAEQYETYYIGDEVVCRERGRELEIV